jgi:hypothetical protein
MIHIIYPTKHQTLPNQNLKKKKTTEKTHQRKIKIEQNKIKPT